MYEKVALNFGMICFPNAKINLGLRILEKREDGFHNIESCFYPIPWCDVLEIIPAEKTSFQSSGIPIPGDASENLCLKAYHLLKVDYTLPEVSIFLHKVVPIGAGMGGGSSDAAYTLKLLNDLFQLSLSEEKLIAYAQKLGSDCAFFIRNQPVIAIDKGDVFQDASLSLRDKVLIAVYPNLHITTGEAYSGVQPNPLHRGEVAEVIKKEFSYWRGALKNDFEASIFPSYDVLERLKNTFYELDAVYASMTGSGSTVFGIFEKEPTDLNLLLDKSFLMKKMVLS